MERIQTAFIASVAVSNCTVPKPLDLWSESKFISARTTLPEKHSSPSRYVSMLLAKNITAAGSCCRAVSKILSCQVNTTIRWGIKQLGIFSGSIFLLFSYGSSRGIILGDPGADSGDEGKSKRAKKYGTKKSKERQEEPLGTMSYQTSSKRFWLCFSVW